MGVGVLSRCACVNEIVRHVCLMYAPAIGSRLVHVSFHLDIVCY